MSKVDGERQIRDKGGGRSDLPGCVGRKMVSEER